VTSFFRLLRLLNENFCRMEILALTLHRFSLYNPILAGLKADGFKCILGLDFVGKHVGVLNGPWTLLLPLCMYTVVFGKHGRVYRTY
jgi:hypothetical protein